MRPSELDALRWRAIDRIFDAALDCPVAERRRLVAELCGDDAGLLAEVEALLEAVELSKGFFDDRVMRHGPDTVPGGRGRPEDRNVGPFVILHEIGRGGMGRVYLAEDTRVGRRVALKMLAPYSGFGSDARRRFQAEARAVSKLDHPNIGTLYETDETSDGQLYMAFAYYEGETLDRRIARGSLPPGEAVHVAIRITRGLAAAHRAGIVHRDVKPSNVLITTGGEVKLLDFGVAKSGGDDLTLEGLRPGTIAYMSPENVRGDPIDGRADLWSLGAVLHEMLTGERAFRGENPASLLYSLLHEPPTDLAGLDLAARARLEPVVLKLLEKDPEDRYPSAEAVLRDLAAVHAGHTATADDGGPARMTARQRTGATPSTSMLRRRFTFGLVASMVLAGGFWLSSRTPADPADPVAASSIRTLAVLPLRNRTGDPAEEPFVEAVRDALVSEIGTLGQLRVLPRAAVDGYRDTDLPPAQIAQSLQVAGVIEGSVAREGDSVAVTVQLVGVSQQRAVWSGSWRGTVGSILNVTGDVTRSLADALGVALTETELARLRGHATVDPRAYDAYALGQVTVQQRSQSGFALAENYFRRAIEIDPSFALPYVALAEAHGSAMFFGLRSPARVLPEVRTLVGTALRIDSTLAQAHATMAHVALYGDWDWDKAERQARQAVRLNPSLAGAHRALSEVLAVRGRFPESLASIRKGSELERLVPFAAFRPVVVLLYMDDFGAAADEARAGLEFFPDFWQGHWLLCQALLGLHRYDQAVSACERAADSSRGTAMALGALGFAYAVSGRSDAAMQIVDRLEARADTTYVAGATVAEVLGALGRLDQAFEWMDRAYRAGDITLVNLRGDLLVDPLRSDPRFAELWRRVGLEGPPPGTGA